MSQLLHREHKEARSYARGFSKVDKVLELFCIMKKSFWKDNYSKCWDFLVECRWFVVGVVGLFAVSFLVGFAYPGFFSEEIFELLREMVSRFEGLTTLEMVGAIFFNNVWKSLIAMVLGVLVGIFPLVSSVINGYVAGFVSHYAVLDGGIFTLWRLLPHGVFELPAVLISMGIGVRIGFDILSGRGKVKENFREGLRFFVFVVVPLLVVAAGIEGLLIGFAN